MESLTLLSSTGKQYKIKLPDPARNGKSSYIFAFHKSGSTLIQTMLESYCRDIGVPTVSLFDSAFSQGISTEYIREDSAECLRREGYIFTGFRHFPPFDFDMKGRRAILLVRDPRDMLVSLYYSVKTSHEIPKDDTKFQRQRHDAEKIDIDNFVLKRRGLYKNAFDTYRKALAESDLTVYRYEDIIYRKAEWLKEIVETLSLEMETELIVNVASQSDIIPEGENEALHIRQVHPGNYKKKLSPTTISTLTNYYKEFLDEYQYGANS